MLVITACASSGGSVAAPPTTAPALALPTEAVVAALVDRWRADYDVPGAVVAVRVGDGPPLIVATGTDAKTGAPLDAHVPFPIASITKTFVGALALQLVDEGKLALDDALSTYVPDFPDADRITIKPILEQVRAERMDTEGVV